MEDRVEYETRVSVCFSELNERLRETLAAKLAVSPETHHSDFRVRRVIGFEVREMLVEAMSVRCLLSVDAIAVRPKVGVPYEFPEWKRFKDRLLVSGDGFQILAEVPGGEFPPEGTAVSIVLDDIKRYADTLACVGKVV